MQAGENEEDNKPYFLGSVVYVERALSTVSEQEAYLVIDGQQRLTTCTLFIAALADFIEKNQLGEPVKGFSPNKLRNHYLFNSEEDGEERFKLILSESDKETLLAILQNTPLPEKHSVRIQENYGLFQELIAKNADKITQICCGLDRLTVVDVALDRRTDNPQLIFESMNSTGLALSQADLIRNYLLMGLEDKLQKRLYCDYWRKMEDLFGQEAYTQYFDAFVRHYLTAQTGDIPNIQNVYQAFKKYAQEKSLNSEQLVKELHTYARYYCTIGWAKDENHLLKHAFEDLNELNVDVAYPLLLVLYHAYQTAKLSADELLNVVRMIESYVFRRAVCGYASNSLNKTFAQFAKLFKQKPQANYLLVEFLALKSYRTFPNDEGFEQYFTTRNVYNFARRYYLLDKLENNSRKEKADISTYTIEHVLPQNPHLSQEWQQELGEN